MPHHLEGNGNSRLAMKAAFRRSALAGLLCSALIVAAAQPSPIPEQQWVGTWATPPTQADTQRSFYQQTLRQIVHTSIGGSHARIRISNLFGSRPLHIEDVHLARWNSGTSFSPARIARYSSTGSLR